MCSIEKFYVELIEGIDYNAQIYLKINTEALEILENIELVGGFISRKDLRNILNIKEHRLKIIIDELLEQKLIYLDKKYNSNILLTSKALSILKEKNIKNKISTEKISDFNLSKNRFLLKLKIDFNYLNKNFIEEFINVYTDFFVENLNQDKALVKHLEEELIKKRIILVNTNVIAIDNVTSVFTLKTRIKEIINLDRYLKDINTIILNQDFIEAITEKELEELGIITKKYKSLYSEDIKYILI